MAGPAAVVSSETVSLQLVSTAYDCPLNPAGMVTENPPATGVATVKVGPVTEMNAAYIVASPEAGLSVYPGVRRVTVLPALTGMAVFGSSDKVGNAFTGSAGLVDGQAVMNAAARVYTSLMLNGVSNGCAKGDSLRELRIYDEWRASTVRIDPAAVR